jgi:hypothetical protein
MKARGTPSIQVYASGLVPLADGEGAPARWEVQVCRLWLRLFARPCRRINTRLSSRGIELLVNAWASRFTARAVGNGAVIQAAIEEGYALRPARSGDAHFDLTLGLWTRYVARERRR